MIWYNLAYRIDKDHFDFPLPWKDHVVNSGKSLRLKRSYNISFIELGLGNRT